MKRILLLVLVLLPMAYFSYKNLRVEQDVVLSIEKSEPEAAALFHSLQGSGLFQNKVFVQAGDKRDEVAAALTKAGYEPSSDFVPKLEDPKKLYALLPYLPNEARDKILGPEHLETMKKQLESWLSSPAGLGMIKQLQDDPLLLSRELPLLLKKGEGPEAPLIAARKGDLNFPAIRELYDFLKKEDLPFVGGDFYALENYEAVHRDIRICTFLSVVLSLAVFRYFCRQWSLLFFLLAGTLVSSVTGLFVTELIDKTLYGLVLVFASTFVSFNTESLVHLAGVDFSKENRKTLIGVFSALGTTIIGFLVLLFSSSQMARQLAILSLASLFGFLAFLLLFAKNLKSMHFRPLSLPQWTWNPRILTLVFVSVAAAILLLPKPSYKTHLEEFRFSSDYLLKKTEEFTKIYSSLPLDNLAAVKIGTEDPAVAYQRLSPDISPQSFHPLQWWANKEDPSAELSLSLTRLNQIFADLGLRLEVDTAANDWIPELNSREYLELWSQIWPINFYQQKSGHLLLFLKAERPDAVPMHPRAFYERILDNLTKNLGEYFLLGLGLMLLYLVPWQRKLSRIALIFLPLMIAGLGLQILFISTGRSISIVHIMGLSLVIAVALDYASILVSSDHASEEQGKVSLTGALTLASFGSLLLAKHPVLKELALIVVLGTGVSLAMALFTRLPPSEES